VHVAGSSYGALTALLVAIDHPELVRTLTIVEPPLIAWLPDLPGGELEYERIMKELIEPVATAFNAGDRERALRISMDFLAGPGSLDQLPPEAVEALRANLPEWEAIMTSRDGVPPVPRAAVEGLGVPVLMISGARTYSFMKLTDAALAGLLPRVHRVIVENATHEVCTEQPQACAAAIGEHLARN
jgi:pimeloyl-ACP methyl ester carboxylesterase